MSNETQGIPKEVGDRIEKEAERLRDQYNWNFTTLAFRGAVKHAYIKGATAEYLRSAAYREGLREKVTAYQQKFEGTKHSHEAEAARQSRLLMCEWFLSLLDQQ